MTVAYLTWRIVTGDVSAPWCLAVFGMVSPRKVWSRTFRSGGSGGGCAGSGPRRSGGAAVLLDLGEDRQQVLAELGVVLGDREVAELGHLPELGALDQLGELPCFGGRGVGVVFAGEQVEHALAGVDGAGFLGTDIVVVVVVVEVAGEDAGAATLVLPLDFSDVGFRGVRGDVEQHRGADGVSADVGVVELFADAGHADLDVFGGGAQRAFDGDGGPIEVGVVGR